MKSSATNPLQLDIQTVIQDGRTLSGQWPLSSLTRLAEGVLLDQLPADAHVVWRIQGEQRPVTGGAPQMWARLCADTEVALTCQRCLAPVREHLSLDRWVRFVGSEAEAEQLDAELEDDVLALPRVLNAQELIEDELLLGLPLVPRHGVCPQLLPVPDDDLPVEPQEHPFAALAGLKGKLAQR